LNQEADSSPEALWDDLAEASNVDVARSEAGAGAIVLALVVVTVGVEAEAIVIIAEAAVDPLA